MKVLLCALALVAVVVAYEEPTRYYHSNYGIAAAARIKQMEQAMDFDGNRIAGGSGAGVGAHPHLGGVVILLVTGQQSVCGSSLISNTRSVTAAHCWTDGNMNARQITLVWASDRLFSGGTHNIRNIALASGTATFAGQWATAAGFGRTGDGNSHVITNNQAKRHVNLQVITNAACANTFGGIVISSTLCVATSGGNSPCPGDSGGPLAVGSGTSRTLKERNLTTMSHVMTTIMDLKRGDPGVGCGAFLAESLILPLKEIHDNLFHFDVFRSVSSHSALLLDAPSQFCNNYAHVTIKLGKITTRRNSTFHDCRSMTTELVLLVGLIQRWMVREGEGSCAEGRSNLFLVAAFSPTSRSSFNTRTCYAARTSRHVATSHQHQHRHRHHQPAAGRSNIAGPLAPCARPLRRHIARPRAPVYRANRAPVRARVALIVIACPRTLASP
ncbi:unnamed protein product [Diatraea saccharalis]|uniref:Peptidase S1 domain-containing protein n=1 Tax=Diatraea saccharalis TaxID=40085 RepID=A0A9N9QUY7_9NEOP|nr:unnamed protein product [Diatraea saccharalis]